MLFNDADAYFDFDADVYDAADADAEVISVYKKICCKFCIVQEAFLQHHLIIRRGRGGGVNSRC